MAFALLTLLIPPSPSLADDLPPSFCDVLVQHIPDADVAYQPGVDVHGHAVAPADLPGSAGAGEPWPVSIPLSARLSKILNLKTNSFPGNALGKTDAQLGTLTLDGNRLLLNGHPLDDAQQENLAVLCLKPR